MRKLNYVGDILVNKYHDKNGIKIWISKDEIEDKEYGITYYVNIEVNKKFLVVPTFLIDYCIDECCSDIKSTFSLLQQRKNSKIARKWLYSNIKEIKFGNTEYQVKNFVLPGGELNLRELQKIYNYIKL